MTYMDSSGNFSGSNSTFDLYYWWKSTSLHQVNLNNTTESLYLGSTNLGYYNTSEGDGEHHMDNTDKP